MKITKRQLKKIIKEEKAKLYEQQLDVYGDPASRQANLLVDFDKAIGKVEAIEKEVWGLANPADPYQEPPYGDELGKQLEVTVGELTKVWKAIELYFDDESGRNPGGSIG
jgi:hypothetical protein